jgi:hypothetical protein
MSGLTLHQGCGLDIAGRQGYLNFRGLGQESVQRIDERLGFPSKIIGTFQVRLSFKESLYFIN